MGRMTIPPSPVAGDIHSTLQRVFGDASLIQMAREKPVDGAGLLNITGVGQHKLEKYGSNFLDAIALYSVEAGREQLS
jgi:ATP-dependent DNA helicase RecQ